MRPVEPWQLRRRRIRLVLNRCFPWLRLLITRPRFGAPVRPVRPVARRGAGRCGLAPPCSREGGRADGCGHGAIDLPPEWEPRYSRQERSRRAGRATAASPSTSTSIPRRTSRRSSTTATPRPADDTRSSTTSCRVRRTASASRWCADSPPRTTAWTCSGSTSRGPRSSRRRAGSRSGPGRVKSQVESGTLQTPLDTATYEGKLYAAPNNTNVQLLWYRSDLVPDAAEDVGRDDLHGRGADGGRASPTRSCHQGKQYEGLVVLLQHPGQLRRRHDPRRRTAPRPSSTTGAVKALETLKKLATSEAIDPSFSNAAEDNARLADGGRQGRVPAQLAVRLRGGAEERRTSRRTSSGRRIPAVSGDAAKVTVGGINYAVSNYTDARRTSRSRRCCACATRRTRSSPRSTTVCRRPSSPSTTTRRWPRRTR